jgi:hypothetical protein
VAPPQGDVAAVKLLLRHADALEAPDLPDARRMVNAANLAGLAPAHFAVWRGHGAALRELVNAGALLTVRPRPPARTQRRAGGRAGERLEAHRRRARSRARMPAHLLGPGAL